MQPICAPFVWFSVAIAACLALAPSDLVAAENLTPGQASRGAAAPSFELDVMPVLTASGCNAGACHGKARGQNGFQLSLLGFDADFDFARLVKDARGRRLFPASPDNSLILRKASARVSHGGGVRLPFDSADYRVVRDWVAAGMPRRTPGEPTLSEIRLSPPERVLAMGESQSLTITAYYSDGSTRDVTRLGDFQSNEPAIVGVSEDGRVEAGQLPGEAAVMARYMGHIAVWSTAIPQPEPVDEALYAALPRRNFIDDLAWAKLKQLRIVPSEAASDSTFLRRAFLDVIGKLPAPEEARAFLADTDPAKRERLIDALLERPEYADHWATKWADLLRPNPYRVGIKATFNFDGWIRESFRRNQPHDQFVRDLVTARGSTWRNGAVTLFRDRREPDEITSIVSQLFLGIRLECAKCHHHPFEVWGQQDYYGLAAYFAKLGRKGTGLSPPISGSEEFVFAAAEGSVSHPTTGEIVPPKPLFGEARPIVPDEDPREALADWMLSPENPYFARVAVNRLWADLMGRGLVEPVDDLRATNPPTNGPLLDALANEFRALGFDRKKMLREIMRSHLYGLSSIPNERNVSDTRNYSRHYRQHLRAETLLDAVCEITGVDEKFDGLPVGSRSNEVWTTRVESLFLDAFGRPDPNQDPPCERNADATVVQALHLMNAPRLHDKLTSDDGAIRRLADSDKPWEAIVEELYLATFSRFPTEAERQSLAEVAAELTVNRRQGAEDLLWALFNSAEFVYKD